MRAVVVGAGAWGLPAATELARRGHRVTLVEAYVPAGPLASSAGATRLWRLAHPDALRVRLALRAVEAWRRLEERSGESLLLRRGLLWRDPASTAQVAAALTAEDVEHTAVEAADVGRFFPALRPTAVDAVWQPEAGPVLAAVAMAAQLRLFEAGGGRLVTGRRAVGVEVREGRGVRVRLDDASVEHADVAVLAPGPWAGPLLEQLGVVIPLRPLLEQVTYLRGGPGAEDLPCWYEGDVGPRTGLYAMPTPGIGYKIGIDHQLRELLPGDTDREPDRSVAAEISARAAEDLNGFDAEVVSSQVCSWTYSPDGRFVIDRLLGDRVVLACGDSGEGFKFSALLGELLADLAEGVAPDDDVASFGLARFAGRTAAELASWQPLLGQ